jgi:hypothetical protein
MQTGYSTSPLHYSRRQDHERSSPVPLRSLCAGRTRLRRLRYKVELSADFSETRPPYHGEDGTEPNGQATQPARCTTPGGKDMNARHLFHNVRYALAALASVGFGIQLN